MAGLSERAGVGWEGGGVCGRAGGLGRWGRWGGGCTKSGLCCAVLGNFDFIFKQNMQSAAHKSQERVSDSLELLL